MGVDVNRARIRLELSSRADNVQIVRQALGGLADATGLSPGDLNDVGTAVTEACNNVSMHAYAGAEGPLKVELLASDAVVGATVRDHGVGLKLDVDRQVRFPSETDGELTGIGVPSIQSLATRVRWKEPEGGGTEVEMVFSTVPSEAKLDGGELDLGADGDLPELCAIEPARLAATIEAGMAPAKIARRVFPRLLRAMAARLHFSLEEHASLQRLGSALLADESLWAPAGCVQARLVAGEGSLELAVGPLSVSDASTLAESIRHAEPGVQAQVTRLDGQKRWLTLRLERISLDRVRGR